MAKYHLRRKRNGVRVIQATLGQKGQIFHVFTEEIPPGADLRQAGLRIADAVAAHRMRHSKVQGGTGEQGLTWER